MLPEPTTSDPEWHSDDGNEEKTHDWFNAIMRSVDAESSPMDGIAHPAPAGTALPWGGGRIKFWSAPGGLADNAIANVDDTMPGGPDYTNREIIVLAGGAYSSNRVPGSGNEYDGQPDYDVPFDGSIGTARDLHFFTKAGAAAADPLPTGGCYLQLNSGAGDGVYLYMSNSGSKALNIANRTGATIYPFLVYFVSDQFPTRT
jgi:hypothetical protein